MTKYALSMRKYELTMTKLKYSEKQKMSFGIASRTLNIFRFEKFVNFVRGRSGQRFSEGKEMVRLKCTYANV